MSSLYKEYNARFIAKYGKRKTSVQDKLQTLQQLRDEVVKTDSKNVEEIKDYLFTIGKLQKALKEFETRMKNAESAGERLGKDKIYPQVNDLRKSNVLILDLWGGNPKTFDKKIGLLNQEQLDSIIKRFPVKSTKTFYQDTSNNIYKPNGVGGWELLKKTPADSAEPKAEEDRPDAEAKPDEDDEEKPKAEAKAEAKPDPKERKREEDEDDDEDDDEEEAETKQEEEEEEEEEGETSRTSEEEGVDVEMEINKIEAKLTKQQQNFYNLLIEGGLSPERARTRAVQLRPNEEGDVLRIPVIPETIEEGDDTVYTQGDDDDEEEEKEQERAEPTRTYAEEGYLPPFNAEPTPSMLGTAQPPRPTPPIITPAERPDMNVLPSTDTLPSVEVQAGTRTGGRDISSVLSGIDRGVLTGIKNARREGMSIKKLKEDIKDFHRIYDSIIPAFRDKDHQKRKEQALTSDNKRVVLDHYEDMETKIANYYKNDGGFKLGVIVSAESLFNGDIFGARDLSATGMIGATTGQPPPTKSSLERGGSQSFKNVRNIQPTYTRGGMDHALQKPVSNRIVPSKKKKVVFDKNINTIPTAVHRPYQHLLQRPLKPTSDVKIKGKKK